MTAEPLTVTALGQSGFVFDFGGTRIVIDPYLTDSLARHSEALRRQIPVVREPGELTDVDWVLLTHNHGDHTDPDTLIPLAAASPGARLIAPYDSRESLASLGVAWSAVVPPLEWLELGAGVSVRTIPAAHTKLERNTDGELRWAGYLLRMGGITIYHAGDTIPHEEIFAALAGEQIDYAMLPVNERNFYRDRAHLVGNLTLREAFRMAADLGVRTLIPVHWDLFAANSTHPEEIELLHRLEAPDFALEFFPAGTVRTLS